MTGMWYCDCFADLSEIITDEILNGIRHETLQEWPGGATEIVYSEESAREVERRCSVRGLQCDVFDGDGCAVSFISR